MNLFKHELRNS